ncbi:MAG: helix-turn-helix domain-containing protein [Gammaproteobacteria bacterium]|nr:helix-turn-helix domain-containing protein [Gammaproteobacteria bacterium]
MRTRRRTKNRHESHVRVYRHELDCAAYRSLSTDARALLVEMRSLYTGADNRIHMSRREAERRLNVGRRRAEHAIDELVDRGFVRVLRIGAFQTKVAHATEYELTNEAGRDKTPSKEYMRWVP